MVCRMMSRWVAGRQEGNPGAGHHPCCAALRSEAVLVCSCQDLTRPETRHCLVHTDERRAQHQDRTEWQRGQGDEKGHSTCRGLKKEQQQQHGRIQKGRKGLDGSGCFCQLRRHTHPRRTDGLPIITGHLLGTWLLSEVHVPA